MSNVLSIQERINFLQRCIIVHSYLYYERDASIIPDQIFDAKSRELVKYKIEYPELWRSSEYYKQFGDEYSGATGFTLYNDLNGRQRTIIRAIARIISTNFNT